MVNRLVKVSQLLSQKGLTIAVAESCTGGLICHKLTNIPCSSAYFERGIVSYSNQAKIDLLGVNTVTLRCHGAVSRQTAEEMAVGIRHVANVDIGLATTGIAGPGGGTTEKPVGLVYIALSTHRGTQVYECHFTGSRQENKEAVSKKTLALLCSYLTGK